jgi:hypothetical protein
MLIYPRQTFGELKPRRHRNNAVKLPGEKQEHTTRLRRCTESTPVMAMA